MSSEKPDASKQTPPPDWKLEFEKQWKSLVDKTLAFYGQNKNLFSLPKIAAALAGTFALVWLASGIYIVGEGNRGVVTRFGAYADTTKPGPHWHLPAPIERVSIVNVEQQRFIEVGYADASRINKAAVNNQESLMLTRDENIISVRLAVQYQINNARDYLFNIKNGEQTLKQLTESVLRGVIGRNDMDFVLTEGRSQIVAEIKSEIQHTMDDYKAGISVASVNLQDAQPPEEVQGAFEDAIRAREDKQRLINEAEAYVNEIIPKARGAASRINQEAEAYAAEKVAKAKGETERFDQLLVEYEKNPAITRKRLFIETKEKLLGSVNKILVNTDQAPALYMPFQPSPVPHGPTASPMSEPSLSSEPQTVDKTAARKAASTDLRPSRSRP
ncbi:MAG: FtsH protease activity modulator HflK [Methylomonas sp.]|nr:FtsH protease activity modulator HflK [Methylomonas sp.]PPD22053.1 MAG: FtsH protease activity modulator HflK [Methylomonas sp.]PPD25245.1 MAG: FtsH protease activity modulator HflK [Methylomonas sp.]PPD35196.1 MAG: FtsH protease activity modulator HflK [Methylomonas sp.]PPD42459.1 MAG: FtsH protease activity modulator HflK [Methylomonas sp.]